MKKFLMIFGGIALVAVLAIAGMIGWAAYRGRALDGESKAFVDAAVPAIASNWNKQELIDRAAPELKAKATPEQLAMIFDTLARLGPMVEYEGATGQATMSYETGAGSNVFGKYDATARFQNGSAVFHIGLVKRDGRWTILNFHVDPSPTPGATNKI
jgi:hypothetical protein